MHNAKIFTGNPAQPEASALAVKNGRIYSVESRSLDPKGSPRTAACPAHRVAECLAVFKRNARRDAGLTRKSAELTVRDGLPARTPVTS